MQMTKGLLLLALALGPCAGKEDMRQGEELDAAPIDTVNTTVDVSLLIEGEYATWNAANSTALISAVRTAAAVPQEVDVTVKSISMGSVLAVLSFIGTNAAQVQTLATETVRQANTPGSALRLALPALQNSPVPVFVAPPSGDDGLSDGAIAGIVIGVLIGVAVIVVLIWYFVCGPGSEDDASEEREVPTAEAELEGKPETGATDPANAGDEEEK